MKLFSICPRMLRKWKFLTMSFKWFLRSTNANHALYQKRVRSFLENLITLNQSISFFFRISYDLIQMTFSLNQEKWISHFVCYAIDFHIVYTHRHKSDANNFMRKTINLIFTRFNQKMIFIRSNEKISLSDDFSDLFIEIDIIF